MIAIKKRYVVEGIESEVAILRGYKGEYYDGRVAELDSKIAASESVAGTISHSADTAEK